MIFSWRLARWLPVLCWAAVSSAVAVVDDACEPGNQQPNWGQLDEFVNCSLTKTWAELALEGRKCFLQGFLHDDECTFQFKNGGLGDLMVEGKYHEWVCVRGDKCASRHSEDYFCYVYSEVNGTFLPWNTNGELHLFEEDFCSDGWPAVFTLNNVSTYGGFTIQGPEEAGLQFGASVHPAGDINGDGIPDMLFSAENHNHLTGAVWVLFGVDDISHLNEEERTISAVDASGFIIVGEASSDFFGSSARYAGDVNGDGVDDIIVGAAGNDPQSRSNAGAAYVIFGRSGGGFPASLSVGELDGSNGFSVHGAFSQDELGSHVSGTGDVNGDGYDDLLVAAWEYDGESVFLAAQGRVYVLFGRANFPAVVDLYDFTSSDGFAITSYTYDLRLSTGSVGWAGDVDGDGYADILIGAEDANEHGEAFLVYGNADGYPWGVQVSALGTDGLRLVGGSGSLSKTGHSVSGVGDVNGDGVADLTVGAYDKQSNGGRSAGEVYVIYGRAERRTGMLYLEDLERGNGTDGFVIKGEVAEDKAGWSVGAAGDFNGDGVSDLVVGACSAEAGLGQAGAADYGAVYVVFGKQGGLGAELELASLDGVAGFKAHGWQAGGKAGFSVMGGFDLNADGYDDVMVGAPDHNEGMGEAYLLLGKPKECNSSDGGGGAEGDGEGGEDGGWEDEDDGWIRCDAARTLGEWDTCTLPSMGCCGAGLSCYVKDTYFHQCMATGSCEPTPEWECSVFVGHPPACASGDGTLSEWQACTHDTGGCSSCNLYGQPLACYRKDDYYSQCLLLDSCPPFGQAGWDCTEYPSSGRR